MKSIISFIITTLLILQFSSCANAQAPQVKQKSKEEVSSPVHANRSRSNMIISTARSANEIEQQYPYDIDLKLADGSIINSAKAMAKNGKPTILLFWLTTCAPCRAEMMVIKSKFADWKAQADFNIYAISIDFQKNFDRFSKMVEDKDWPWPAYNDVNREFLAIMPGNLNGLPQSFVLNAEGEIVYHKRKWRPGDEDRLFEKVLEVK